MTPSEDVVDPGPAVALGPALAGSLRAHPGVRVSGAVPIPHSEPAPDEPRAYWAWLPSHRLAQLSFFPFSEPVTDADVHCRSQGGYQDRLDSRFLAALRAAIATQRLTTTPPPLLSARGMWRARVGEGGSELDVYDSAAIVVNGEVLVAATSLWREEGRTWPLAFVVYLNLPIAEEVDLYKTFRTRPQSTAIPSNAIETLRITTSPVIVEFLSEPFITATRRGYTPMIKVRSLQSQAEMGMYIQATSLGTVLEEIRARRGHLTGVVAEICKESSAQYALYVVRELA